MIVDKIIFKNLGTYTNPYHGATIKGRSEKDYRTKVTVRLSGTQAEDLEGIIEDYLRRLGY